MVVWNERKPLCEGEASCKVQVSWLSLGSGVCDIQRMALLDRLPSLLHFRGDHFGKKVRRHAPMKTEGRTQRLIHTTNHEPVSKSTRMSFEMSSCQVQLQ